MGLDAKPPKWALTPIAARGRRENAADAVTNIGQRLPQIAERDGVIP
jgi:hypothetical protein